MRHLPVRSWAGWGPLREAQPCLAGSLMHGGPDHRREVRFLLQAASCSSALLPGAWGQHATRGALCSHSSGNPCGLRLGGWVRALAETPSCVASAVEGWGRHCPQALPGRQELERHRSAPVQGEHLRGTLSPPVRPGAPLTSLAKPGCRKQSEGVSLQLSPEPSPGPQRAPCHSSGSGPSPAPSLPLLLTPHPHPHLPISSGTRGPFPREAGPAALPAHAWPGSPLRLPPRAI